MQSLDKEDTPPSIIIPESHSLPEPHSLPRSLQGPLPSYQDTKITHVTRIPDQILRHKDTSYKDTSTQGRRELKESLCYRAGSL